MIYVLESFRRSRIGVSTKKINTHLPLKEVNKHFFDLLTQTHMSSSAVAAAAGRSQLRWFCKLFVGWIFINRGQKPLKKIGFHSPSRTHTGKSTSQRKHGKFFFLATIAGSPRKITQTLLHLILGTITRPEEGNCFYSKHQTDCKYFSRVCTQKHNSITSHQTLQFPMVTQWRKINRFLYDQRLRHYITWNVVIHDQTCCQQYQGCHIINIFILFGWNKKCFFSLLLLWHHEGLTVFYHKTW